MKPGRLITDIAFRKEVQFQLEETKNNILKTYYHSVMLLN